MTYKHQRKAKIAVKSATLRHDVLSIAREASAAPAATFRNAVTGKVECWYGTWPVARLHGESEIGHRKPGRYPQHGSQGYNLA